MYEPLFLRLKKSRAKSTFKGLLFLSVPSSWWYYDTPRLHTVRREARANALNQKVVRPVPYVSQMNGCNLYQRLNVNHRGNRRGTVLQYSTVLQLCPHPHKLQKDGTTSGPGPEPPPMDISTRPVVHRCDKTARCGRSWHAQPRIRPRGASGRASRASARKCRSLSDLFVGTRTVSPDISGRRSRRNKRKAKKRKAEKKKVAPDKSHATVCSPNDPDKKKGLFRKLDLSRM